MGYLAQEASVFRRLSVEDNIRAVLEMTDFSKEYQTERVESLIEEFRLQKVRKSLGIQLSGGERRRTEIARAVAINPAFILLDEPFAGVDPIAVEDIQSIVATLKHKNIGVIITDHNVDETLAITDRTYLLYEGKILKTGTAEELAADPMVRKVYLGQRFEDSRKSAPAHPGDEKPQRTGDEGVIMDKTAGPGRVKGTLTPPCSEKLCPARPRGGAAFGGGFGAAQPRILRRHPLGPALHRGAGRPGPSGGPHDALHPRGARPRVSRLDVGESGLATRLFTPLASLCSTPIVIEGRDSLLRRPMGMMLEPLRRLGVTVRDNDGYLPVEVRGPIRGGEVEVDGSVSSQFITGLLLALPKAGQDTTMHVHGAVSTPYLDMTLDTAARFGVEISQRDYEEFYIPGRQHYRSTYFSIEGDWSAAAMLLVAGATAGEVTVRNVSMLSKQADTAICTALVRAGAAVINEPESVTVQHRPLRAFEFDATNCPDLFPALAALAAAADGVSEIRGTSRLEYKECNRAEAIRDEYAKLGIEVDTSEEDLMRIRGGQAHGAHTRSHGDHRMAMSLAVAALRADGEITIEGAESVAKSYPGFFEDLEHIRY